MADLNAIPGLKGKLGATRARLGRLAFVRAFWPALLFAGLFLIAALLGLFLEVSPVVAAGVSIASFLAMALLVLRGMRRWQRPGAGDALTALDQQSDMRPITGLRDRPAVPTHDAQALWRVHTDRLKTAATGLKTPGFADRWRKADPAYLRFAIPVIIAGLLVAVGQERAPRLQSAFMPNLGALAGADQIRVEAWITPPRHTGRAPIFLEPGMDGVRVPAGSEITLRAFNRAAPDLLVRSEDGRTRRAFEATPDGAFEARETVTADARISVHWWGERVGWDILASPDSPPTARFVSLPALTTDDEMEFDWAAADDFGVQRLELAIRLRNPHPAAPDAEDRLTIPMGAMSPKEVEEAALLDTMRHRWAGLPVDVQLVAIDGAGQEGRSLSYPFVLPEKLLLQPLAKAAQEVRVSVLREPRAYAPLAETADGLRQDAINVAATQRLVNAPPDVQRAAEMLDALTLAPEAYFRDRSIYLGLRMAHSILASAPDKAEADSVDNLLWSVALKAEYGSSADALRALQAARRALEQALRDGASEDEIRRLMEAFKEAANNYIAAKMAEAIMNGGEAPNMSDMGQQGGGNGLGASDFQDMLDALEDLAETGAADQARQLLSDITNMLENLEFQQGGSGGEDGFAMPGGEGGEPGEQGEMSEGEREMTDALEALSDLLREQRELNDDTLAEQRGEGPSQQGQQGEPGAPGENGEPGEGGPGGLGDRQRGLSGRSGALADGELGEGGGVGSAGEEAGESAGLGALDDAARERLDAIAKRQEQAARALEQGDTARANRLQEQATESLRDLSSELAQQLDDLQQARLGDREPEGSEGELDPFGRAVGGTGAGDGRSVTIPDEAERQRARDILDELRRRYENSDDAEEREYLERLLNRF